MGREIGGSANGAIVVGPAVSAAGAESATQRLGPARCRVAAATTCSSAPAKRSPKPRALKVPANPEAGDKADLRHLDETQSPRGIDPKPHRPTAQQAGTQARSNRRGGETSESGHSAFALAAPADGTQGDVVIEGERAVTD